MSEIGIADKVTLDQVKALIGATGDGVGIASLFGRLALLAAYVDQLEGFTDELESRLTAVRAGYLDYLNSLNARLTDARAVKLDFLDALVSSRAPASTALSSAIWTATRAALLDGIGNIGDAANAAGSAHAKLKDIKNTLNTTTLSNTTPKCALGYASGDVYSTLVNIAGTGYLTGLHAFPQANVYGRGIFKVTIDGIVVVDGIVLAQQWDDSSSTDYEIEQKVSSGFSMLWRFKTSLLVQIKSVANSYSTVCDCTASYMLD